MTHQVSLLILTFHVLGVIGWIGSALAIGLIGAQTDGEGASEQFTRLRGVMRQFTVPSMLVAWLAGLGVLVPNFMTAYKSAGWMHGKLLFVVIASGLTGALSANLRRAAEGEEGAPRKIRTFFAVLMGVAGVVVALVMMQPGR